MATIRARTQTTPIMTRALDAFCSATSEGIGDSLLTNCWFVYWSTFKFEFIDGKKLVLSYLACLGYEFDPLLLAHPVLFQHSQEPCGSTI